MKTNSKDFNSKIYPYILKAIDSEGYGITTSTDIEKLIFLANTFKSEYCFPDNLKRYKTYQETLRQWIIGLPSCFNIDFENYRIIEIANEWGSLSDNSTEKQIDKVLENWFNLIAFKTMQLFRKYNIEL